MYTEGINIIYRNSSSIQKKSHLLVGKIIEYRYLDFALILTSRLVRVNIVIISEDVPFVLMHVLQPFMANKSCEQPG